MTDTPKTLDELRHLIAKAYCCGDAACYNESCGVPCAVEKTFKTADAILDALEAHGVALMPVVETEAMVDAAWSSDAASYVDDVGVLDSAGVTYRAMLAARPYREKTND